MSGQLLKLKWRQSSPDRKIGLEKEEEAAVNKNGKRRGREQSAQKQLMLPLRGLARAALWDTVVISGLAFVEEEMERSVLRCADRATHIWPSARRCAPGTCRARW